MATAKDITVPSVIAVTTLEVVKSANLPQQIQRVTVVTMGFGHVAAA